MIEVDNLTKLFGEAPNEVRALDGVSLAVERGEILAVVGQSGSGKSTLVRCLTLLEQPTSGRVVLDGQVITELPEAELRKARRAIGQVFQHANLLDNRTARRNVEYPLEIAGWAAPERRARATELLELVGLGDRIDNYPAQLSGGQQQRVGIARALAAEPEVLLCDEPTSALDPATTDDLLELLSTLRDRLGVTIIIITHDLGVVRRIADRVAVLESGRIIASGAVADVAAEADSVLLSDLRDPIEATINRLRITGGPDQAAVPFLTLLGRELDLDVRLHSGGAHAVGTTHVIAADLDFDSDDDRRRAATWLSDRGFTVVEAA